MGFRNEKFSYEATEALLGAVRLATEMKFERTNAYHVFLAALEEGSGGDVEFLKETGLSSEKIRGIIDELYLARGKSMPEPSFSPPLKAVIDALGTEAHVGRPKLLRALLLMEPTGSIDRLLILSDIQREKKLEMAERLGAMA